jgi:hypothetical protein
MQTIFKTLVLLCGMTAAFSACESGGDTLSPSGQGGSMARFALSGEYLYVLNKNSLHVFTTGQDTFAGVAALGIADNIETIFIQGEHLYLGATDGMYIYSIAEPVNPAFVFFYSHVVACDPVVVQGNRAYVTLRSGGTRCNRGSNALEILDITDRYSPALVADYPMQSPHGLGVAGNLLFICDGAAGLKVYDITVEQSIKLVASVTTHPAYDVIVRDGLAQVTGEAGIFQYRYNTAGQLQLLSTIPVVQEER